MSAASIGRALQGGGDRLTWKAYAIALRTHLSTTDKLDLSAKVIFVASPLQYGIPAGTLVPNEITNEQLYRKADAVQDRRSRSYSFDGGSYFEFAREYLMGIQDALAVRPKTLELTSCMTKFGPVQEHCAEAYLKDVGLYRNSGAAEGTSMNFEAWMSKFGIFYPALRKEQDRVKQKLHELAQNPMEGAAIALAHASCSRNKALPPGVLPQISSSTFSQVVI